MVKNTSGGNKTKKKKRSRVIDIYNTENEGQYFGKIVRNMGGHFGVIGLDNVERIGKLRNAMKRGPRINADTFVVYSIRDFSDKNECDIIGIANPPDNIITQFDAMNPKKKNSDICFKEENDEFNNVDKIAIEDNKISNDYNDSIMPEYESEEYNHDYSYENNVNIDNEKEVNDDDYEKYNNMMNQDIDFSEDFEDLDDIEDFNETNENKSIKQEESKLKPKKNEKEKKEEEFNNVMEETENINFDDINFDDI